MKRLLEAFRSARKVEVFIVVAMLCVLAVLSLGNGDVGREGASEEELRIERILSQIEGAGRVSVMIALDETGGRCGAVVVCSGAEDMRVLLEIQRSMQALTGLELSRIEVMKSKR